MAEDMLGTAWHPAADRFQVLDGILYIDSVPQFGAGGVPAGNRWYVDAKLGADGNSGKSWTRPFLTMSKAFDAVRSGDVIYARGKIKEQLTTPAGVFDVTIVGAGNKPRHADDHTESDGKRGSSSGHWAAPDSATASTPLLKVQQQGWRTVNMLFGAAPSATPSVLLFRDGGAGNAERDASHFHMIGCRIDGSPIGLQDSGGCAFVRIEDTLFRGMTTVAMNNVTGAGIGTLLCWQILNNHFHDNVSHIRLPLSQGSILKNTLGKFTASTGFGIDLTGGVGNNGVHGNYLSGDYDGDYVAATNDSWAGNYTMDTTSGEVGDDSGITTAVPVA